MADWEDVGWEDVGGWESITPTKKETPFIGDLTQVPAHFLGNIAQGTDTALSFAAAGLARLAGASPESIDQIFKGMEERKAADQAFLAEKANNVGTIGQIASGVATGLGSAPTFVASSLGSAAEKAIPEGASTWQTIGIAAPQIGIQGAAAMIPGGRLAQAGYQAGAAYLGNEISSITARSQKLPQTAEAYKEAATDPVNLATAAGMGFALPSKPVRSKDPVILAKQKAAELLQKKVEPPPKETPPPVYKQQLDLPLDISRSEGIDTSGVRNPYDRGGIITDLKSGKEMALNDETGSLINLKDGNPKIGLFSEKEAQSFVEPDFPLSPVDIAYSKVLDTEAVLRAWRENLKGKNLGDLDSLLQKKQIQEEMKNQAYDELIKAQQAEAPIEIKGPTRPTSGEGAPTLTDWRQLGKATKQGGEFKPEAFLDGFEKLIKLPSGYKLWWSGRGFKGELGARYISKGTIISPRDEPIGEINFEPVTNPKLKTTDIASKWTELKENFRGKGIPDEVYREVAKFGDIIPDTSLTPDGKRMWDRFEENGLAQGGRIPMRQDYQTLGKATKQSGSILSPQEAKEAFESIKNRLGFGKIVDQAMKQSTQKYAMADKQRVAAEKLIYEYKGDGKWLISKENLKQFIHEPTPPSEIVGQLLDEGPIKGPWSLIGGKEMIAKIKDSAAVDSFANFFKRAEKLHDLYRKDTIVPLEQKVHDALRGREAEILFNVLKQEQFARHRLTKEELAQIPGLTQKGIDIYDHFRSNMDKAESMLQDKLTEAGIEPFKPEDAYLTSSFDGAWQVPVYNKEGNLVWYIAEHSKAMAENALEYLRKNDPSLDINEHTKNNIEYNKKLSNQMGSGYLEAYRYLANFLGKNEPSVQRAKELYMELKQIQAEGIRGIPRHLMDKGNIRGFAGDRPWRDSLSDVKAGWKAQFRYMENTSFWANMQDAINNAKQVLGDERIQGPEWNNTRELFEELSKHYMGIGVSPTATAAENFVSKSLSRTLSALDKATSFTINGEKHSLGIENIPTDVRQISTGIGNLKSIFYHTKLGVGNLIFGTVALSQPIFMFPWMMEAMGKGYKGNMGTAWIKGTSVGAGILAYHGFLAAGKEGMARKILNSMPEFDRAAAQYIDANQVAQLNPMAEIKELGRSEALRNIEKYSTWTMSMPERVARTGTFMTFAHFFKDAGMSWMDAFQKAEDYTKLVMSNFEHSERAMLFNRMGVTGNVLSTLKTFTINQMNSLYHFGKYFAKTGDPSPFLSMLLIQFSLAGMAGIYGVDTIDKLLNLLKTPINIPQVGVENAYIIDPKHKDFYDFRLKEFLIKHMGDWAYGPLSKITGLNWSSKFDMGSVFDPSFSKLVPFSADYDDYIMGAVADFVNHKDLESLQKALRNITPTSLRGFAESLMSTYQIPQENGNTLVTAYSDPGKGIYIRSPEEQKTASRPFIGMMSLKEHEAREADYQSKTIAKIQEKAMAYFVNKFNRAIRNGDYDSMMESAVNYAQYSGGKMDGLVRSIKPALMNRYMDMEAKLAIRAHSPHQIETLRRYQQLRGQ